MVALKGAFLSFGAGLLGALPNIVVFQFNPVDVTRTPTVAEPAPSSPIPAPSTHATSVTAGRKHHVHPQGGCQRSTGAEE